jgi:hypothetical protein
MAETADDVHDVLGKARQMYETGLANVSIADHAGWRRIGRLHHGKKEDHRGLAGSLGSVMMSCRVEMPITQR